MAAPRVFAVAGVALLAVVVFVSSVGGQQQKSSAPESRDLIKELSILDAVGTARKNGANMAQAPGLDTYYLDVPEEEWIPDEFMSNPDRRIDLKKLKGYHIPPMLKEIRIVGPKKVKAGEAVRFEAVVFNKYKMNQFSVNYHGPNGRRTEANTILRPTKDQPVKQGDLLYQKFEGTLRVNKWAEPGTYLLLGNIGGLSNELGHSKAYRADYHPALDATALSFEVEDNPDADVTAPVLKKLVLGSLDGTPPTQPLTQKITELIPVYAEIEDDRSGVEEAVITLASPTRRYSDITLQPMLNRPNAFVGYFRINRWYEGGEYWVSRIIMTDAAGNERTSFPQSTSFMKEARINLVQDNADMAPPKLITISMDRETAKPGDNVKITALVADDKSGVGEVSVSVHSPSSIDKRRVMLKPTAKPPVMIKPAYDVEENLFEGTFTIHPDDEPGVWQLNRVVARDLANNYLDMITAYYPEMFAIRVTFLDATGQMPVSTAVTGDTGYRPDGASPAAQTGQPAKIRRVDMIPPHPPRGACLNCHEP